MTVQFDTTEAALARALREGWTVTIRQLQEAPSYAQVTVERPMGRSSIVLWALQRVSFGDDHGAIEMLIDAAFNDDAASPAVTPESS